MNTCTPDPKPGKKKKKKRGVSPAKLKKVYANVLKRDDYRCKNPYCKAGWPLDPPHHVSKRSAYGLDVEENLITCCNTCHTLIHREWLNVSGIAPDDLTWIVKT